MQTKCVIIKVLFVQCCLIATLAAVLLGSVNLKCICVCLACIGKDDSLSEDVKKEDIKTEDDTKEDDDVKGKAIKEEVFDEHKKVKLDDSDMSVDKMESVNFSEVLREEMDRLMADNKRLENLVTEIHQRHHEITIKVGSCVVYFFVESGFESCFCLEIYVLNSECK